jgi:hypothetical protein
VPEVNRALEILKSIPARDFALAILCAVAFYAVAAAVSLIGG